MSWFILIICLLFVFACSPKMEASTNNQPSLGKQYYDYSTDVVPVPTLYNTKNSVETVREGERYYYAPEGTYGITRENFYYLNGG